MTQKLPLNPRAASIDLSEAALMRAAQQQTGLSDWGDDNFREGMQILLQTCRQEAGLSLIGQKWLQTECLRWLANRLRIQATLTQHPEILAIPVRSPLFIIGLPRSGTTFLHRLLAETPGARVPLFWELLQPAPSSQTATGETDPRIAQAAAYIHELEAFLPTVASMHLMQPTIPEECYLLFQNAFTCFDTAFFYHIPSYQNWIGQIDQRPAYLYYKQQLQILSWSRPGAPWILKNPGHLLGVEAILATFPDARIVHLHRHPYQSIASLCSVQSNVMNLWRDTPLAPEQVGEIVINRWSLPLQRVMQIRATANPAQFYDLQYSDLLADPIGTVQQLYAHYHQEIHLDTVGQMQHWLDNNRQHKHGKHEYTLATFGLDTKKIDEKFADYIEYFRVKL